jgi:predicted RecB family nuclease
LKKNTKSSTKTCFEIVAERLKEKQKLIVDSKQISFKNTEIDLVLDGISKDRKNNFVPILVSPFEKVSNSDKLFIALQAYFLKQNFHLKIEEAVIILGKQQKKTKVILNKLTKKLKKTIADIDQIARTELPPVFYKNAHCQHCEFNLICEAKLKERDDLSLLGNIKPKEIEQKNNRGIFSVKQLSYTFRPKKSPHMRRKYLPELKALAIREKKVFIQKLPELEKKETEIFFDIEGIPDRDFYYLIGVVIKREKIMMEYSFWADDINQQQDIFIKFFDLLDTHSNFILYHYGSYEIRALKRISKKIPNLYQDKIKHITENSVNILTLISNDIYIPNYNNGLKDIANYSGFHWSNEKASGLQSIIWRYEWEISQEKELKNSLITYNIEDCRALIQVQNWLVSLSENKDKAVLIDKFKQQNIFKWGVTIFALEEFKEINAKAYFDYQRQHIYLRTERKVYKAVSNNQQSSKQYNQIDKRINLFPDECEFCKSKDISYVRRRKKDAD